MENTLMMDVRGAWVRKPEVSSVEQMNAWADEKERQFVVMHLGGQTDPLKTESSTDRGIEQCDLSLR